MLGGLRRFLSRLARVTRRCRRRRALGCCVSCGRWCFFASFDCCVGPPRLNADRYASSTCRAMTARFFVTRTFTISSQNLFVLSGRILSGEIKPGMEVHIPCNASFSITAPVHGVEFVDGPGRKPEVGLTVQYEDDDELSWKGSTSVKRKSKSALPEQTTHNPAMQPTTRSTV